MPKNRQKSVPVSLHPDGDRRNNQPTMNSNCYISLAWWEHSSTVQMGTIRPDGLVGEHVEHNLEAPVHIIADGLNPETAFLEPGWFVHLDEAGLKEHIRQCRRAGRRVFGWSKGGDRDRRPVSDMNCGYDTDHLGHLWVDVADTKTYRCAGKGADQPEGLETAACPGWPYCGGSHEHWATNGPGNTARRVVCLPPSALPNAMDTVVCLMSVNGVPPVHGEHNWQDNDDSWHFCPGVPLIG